MTFSIRLLGANKVKLMEINDKNTIRKGSYVMTVVIRTQIRLIKGLIRLLKDQKNE
jgi:hypothetical protein